MGVRALQLAYTYVSRFAGLPVGTVLVPPQLHRLQVRRAYAHIVSARRTSLDRSGACVRAGVCMPDQKPYGRFL